jgi:hypothetical protein
MLAVFLCLAALYESWAIPVAVMLVVPLGVLGALAGVSLRDMPNDVYFKVGLITIIGLSAKNAILIIEFAKDLQAEGKGLIEATLMACHLRFRPIVMTSLAFILGVLPLALASGAGSASQRAIGTGVMGGMITATVLAVFFVPVFFVVVRRLFPARPRCPCRTRRRGCRLPPPTPETRHEPRPHDPSRPSPGVAHHGPASPHWPWPAAPAPPTGSPRRPTRPWPRPRCRPACRRPRPATRRRRCCGTRSSRRRGCRPG